MSTEKPLNHTGNGVGFWWCSLALVLLVGLTFGQNVSHSFLVVDDGFYIYQNRVVRQGFTADNLWKTFGVLTRDVPTWHPLTWWSLMLDWQIWNGWPGGFFITHMVLHTAAAIFLFAGFTTATGQKGWAWLVAALFAVHPLQAECVAWASERKGLLGGMFGLASIMCYVFFTRSTKRRWIWYSLAVGGFALSCLGKQSLVTMPALLLVFDWWPLRRWPNDGYMTVESTPSSHRYSIFRLLIEKIPFAFLAAAAIVAAYWAQDESGSVKTVGYPLWVRITNMPLSYIAYLRKTLLPFDLAIYYPHPQTNIDIGSSVGCGFIFFIISAIAWSVRKQLPGVLVGWAFFVICIFPLAGLVQLADRQYADRYMYIPIVGLLMAMVSIVFFVAERLLPRPFSTQLIACLGTAMLLSYVGFGCVQTGYFKNSRTAFRRALDVSGPNDFICCNLGLALMDEGEHQAALDRFEEALRVNPRSDLALELASRCYELMGLPQRAIKSLELAVSLNPQRGALVGQLASLHFDQGNVQAAEQLARRSLEIDPQVETGWLVVGQLAMLKQNCGQAVEALRRAAACQYKRYTVKCGVLLAQSLTDCQQIEAAEQTLETLIQEEPLSPTAHYELGILKMIQGQRESGLAHLEEACRIAPGWEQARQSRDRARQELGSRP
jgi:protein O-mannosyl-transferase